MDADDKTKYSISRLWPHDFPTRVIGVLMASVLFETIAGLAFYTFDMIQCAGDPTCIQTPAKVSNQILPQAISSIAIPDPDNDRFLILLCANVALMVALPHFLTIFWTKYVVSLARTAPGYEVKLRRVFKPARLALVLLVSFVMLLCAWATLYFGNVGIPFVRNQSYLFCLYTLFSNAFWTWILFKIIRRIYPDRLGRNQRPSPLPLRAFLQRVNVHWTVLHVAAAPIIRALFHSEFASEGEKCFGRDLQFAYQETSFFVWSAVFTTRMLQIGSETFFSLLVRRFQRRQREAMTSLDSVDDLNATQNFKQEPRYLRRLRATQRDRTTDVWFAFTVLFAYSYIFGIGFPVTSLLSILGILLEWAFQYYRVKALKVPERGPDAKPFLARFMIFDLRMFSFYAVVVLAIVLPLRAERYWIVIATGAISFVISWSISIVFIKRESNRLAPDLSEFELANYTPRNPTIHEDKEANHAAYMHKSHYVAQTPSTEAKKSTSVVNMPTKANTYSESDAYSTSMAY